MTSKRWLSTQEAADYLAVTHRWLTRAREEGGGPPWHKFRRLVRYDRLEVDAWTEAQLVTPRGLPEGAAEQRKANASARRTRVASKRA
jgi:excisionase family DNA binding protein